MNILIFLKKRIIALVNLVQPFYLFIFFTKHLQMKTSVCEKKKKKNLCMFYCLQAMM